MNCYYPTSNPDVTCDQASGIWIGDPRGGTHQLVSFEGSGQSGSPDAAEHASFAWSPDGTSIAYVSPAADSGLYIAREDGVLHRIPFVHRDGARCHDKARRNCCRSGEVPEPTETGDRM